MVSEGWPPSCVVFLDVYISGALTVIFSGISSV